MVRAGVGEVLAADDAVAEVLADVALRARLLALVRERLQPTPAGSSLRPSSTSTRFMSVFCFAPPICICQIEPDAPSFFPLAGAAAADFTAAGCATGAEVAGAVPDAVFLFA